MNTTTRADPANALGLLVMVLLIALVITIHIVGPTTLAAALTPVVGLVLVVLAAWTLKARG